MQIWNMTVKQFYHLWDKPEERQNPKSKLVILSRRLNAKSNIIWAGAWKRLHAHPAVWSESLQGAVGNQGPKGSLSGQRILWSAYSDAGRTCYLVGKFVSRLIWQHITKTRLYNFDPLKSHFYIVKLGFIGLHIIFSYFCSKNIDCGNY